MDPLDEFSHVDCRLIVRAEGRDVAADGHASQRSGLPRELGFKAGEVRPAGPREIDDLDLPDAALGIAPEDAFRDRWRALVGDWMVRDHRARVSF